MVASFEGCVLKRYRDFAGVWTIGYGHALTRKELDTGTYDGVILTPAQAWLLFLSDLDVYDDGVSKRVDVETTQAQHNALVSFAFNEGIGAFDTSTMRRLLNAGQFEAAGDEFPKWNKYTTEDEHGIAYLVESSVLTQRRAVERKLFLTGTVTLADIARTRIAQEESLRMLTDSDPDIAGLVHAGDE